MISFPHYLKSKFLKKRVLVDCFNMKQVQGELEKVYSNFIVVRINKQKIVSVQLNSVAFVQEVEK